MFYPHQKNAIPTRSHEIHEEKSHFWFPKKIPNPRRTFRGWFSMFSTTTNQNHHEKHHLMMTWIIVWPYYLPYYLIRSTGSSSFQSLMATTHGSSTMFAPFFRIKEHDTHLQRLSINQSQQNIDVWHMNHMNHMTWFFPHSWVFFFCIASWFW